MPRFVAYGHRYLGPGNTVRSGRPIDTDDTIAQEHDALYEIAQERKRVTPDVVSSIDAHAIDDFLYDWQQSGNWHSLVGGIGLIGKRQYENVFGVQYPSMSKRSHSGREDYIYASKKLKEIYRRDNPSGASWNEFQKLHFGALLKEAREQRADGTGVHVDRAGGKSTERDVGDATTSSGVGEEGGEPVPGTSAGNRDTDLLDNAADNDAMAQMDVDSMETLANPSKGGGTSGHSSGGRGGGGIGIVGIPRNPKSQYNTRTYTKHWVFFSYGFANKVINQSDYSKLWCTPLSLIPVDYLPLYMDATEYLQLRGRVIAAHCRATVTPLGCRMNFQTSATESKWATSEFVAIGQSAIGLNTHISGKNRTYTPDASKAMIINDAAIPNIQNIESKLYGKDDNQGAIQLVPRHLNLYWCGITAGTTAAADRTQFVHRGDAPCIDRYVDRWLVNTTIGQPVVAYEYAPKNGIIIDVYGADASNENQVYRTASHATEMNIATASTNTEPPVLREDVIAQNKHTTFDNINKWDTNPIFQHNQTIECYDRYRWNSGHVENNMQPQVHVGLTAIPAINPGTEQTDFQNASIYWGVSCELTVHEYNNSCYHKSVIITPDPNYYPPNYIKKYHSGYQHDHFPNLHADQRYGAYDTLEDISMRDLHKFPMHSARAEYETNRIRERIYAEVASGERNLYKQRNSSQRGELSTRVDNDDDFEIVEATAAGGGTAAFAIPDKPVQQQFKRPAPTGNVARTLGDDESAFSIRERHQRSGPGSVQGEFISPTTRPTTDHGARSGGSIRHSNVFQ